MRPEDSVALGMPECRLSACTRRTFQESASFRSLVISAASMRPSAARSASVASHCCTMQDTFTYVVAQLHMCKHEQTLSQGPCRHM